MYLQRKVDESLFLIQLSIRNVGIFRLQLVEISQLIQAQQAQLPEPRIVDVAFLQRDLAPNHFIAGGGIALEFDAPDVELLAFIHVDIKEDLLLVLIEMSIGHRSEVDIALRAIGLAQIFQSLGYFIFAEDVAIFDGEEAAQRLHVRYGLIVLEGDRTQRIAVALLDHHRDVDGFARTTLQQRNVRALMSGVVNLRLGFARVRLEIPAILIFIPDALRVFIQLGGVVSSGKDIFQENRVRHADGPQVLHGGAQHPRLDVFIALELDLAHLDLGPLFDHKRNPNRGRRNLPDLRPDGRELPSVLRQQPLDRHFRLLQLRRIVLALHRQADFSFFETVQHIAGGNRTQTDIVDLADGGFFLDLDNQPPALGSLLAVEADIFEVSRIPQCVEIALQRGGIENIPRMSKDPRLDGLRRNPAIAGNVDLRNDVALRPGPGDKTAGKKNRQHNAQRPPANLHSATRPPE